MKANIPPRRHRCHSKSPILEMALTSELRAGQGIGAYQHRQTCKMLQHVAMCTFGQHLQTPSNNVAAFDKVLEFYHYFILICSIFSRLFYFTVVLLFPFLWSSAVLRVCTGQTYLYIAYKHNFWVISTFWSNFHTAYGFLWIKDIKISYAGVLSKFFLE